MRVERNHEHRRASAKSVFAGNSFRLMNAAVALSPMTYVTAVAGTLVSSSADEMLTLFTWGIGGEEFFTLRSLQIGSPCASGIHTKVTLREGA